MPPFISERINKNYKIQKTFALLKNNSMLANTAEQLMIECIEKDWPFKYQY